MIRFVWEVGTLGWLTIALSAMVAIEVFVLIYNRRKK